MIVVMMAIIVMMSVVGPTKMVQSFHLKTTFQKIQVKRWEHVITLHCTIIELLIDFRIEDFIPTSGDFYPFTSSAEAFIFTLIHSPRPIVSYNAVMVIIIHNMSLFDI